MQKPQPVPGFLFGKKLCTRVFFYPSRYAMRMRERQMLPQAGSGEIQPIARNPFESRVQKARKRFGGLQTALERVDPDHFMPVLAGRGGEHLVFEVPKKDLPDALRDVVVKVNYLKSLDAIKARAEGDEWKIERADEDMRDEVRRREESIRELRKFFGHHAVPAQQLMIREVPVSSEVVRMLHVNMPEDVPECAPAIIVVQRRLDLPKEKKGTAFLEVTGYYPEQRFASPEGTSLAVREVYDDAHDLFVGAMAPEDIDQEEAIEDIRDMFPVLRDAVSRVEEEKRLPDEKRTFTHALRAFVSNLVRYTKNTGIALDLAGKNNVVFLKEGADWQPKLLDVLPIGQVMLKDLEEVVSRLKYQMKEHGGYAALSSEDASCAVNPLNTVRIINALAILADVPDRVDVEGLQDIEPVVWREGLANYFKPEIRDVAR